MENTEKKMTFETALARLEEIVRAMESGSAKLDESLALLRRAWGLSNSVRASLTMPSRE